jgi:hypothetical protein
MPITDLDVPARTDQGRDIPHLTDRETARTVSVFDDAVEAAEVLARGRRGSSFSRLDSADEQADLLTPGEAQPWDY